MQKQESSTAEQQLTMQVVNHVRMLIESGALQPGDKIPAERDFARELHISRASLRTGIGYLAALGVIKVRHGVGAFVADGPPELGRFSFALLGALHGFKTWQLFEARQMLEGTLAALAAERGREEHFSMLAEEVAELYATVEDPSEYLIHDVRFHRTIGEASGNPILAALMETITTALYDNRREKVEGSASLKESAEMHHDIYRAIRARDGAKARQMMDRHLKLAETEQGMETFAPGTTRVAAPRRRAKKM